MTSHSKIAQFNRECTGSLTHLGCALNGSSVRMSPAVTIAIFQFFLMAVRWKVMKRHYIPGELLKYMFKKKEETFFCHFDVFV